MTLVARSRKRQRVDRRPHARARNDFQLADWPWTFLAIGVLALAIQLAGAGPVRGALIYDRAALAAGEMWRWWTAHVCHFGWTHFIADTGLFLIIGWTLERRFPHATRVTLLALPVCIVAALYWFAPEMNRYAGLSGVNVGLLVFLSLDGWRRQRRDWFWPAVLGVHVIELVLEALRGGAGGGAIRFDEPAIHVATVAHIAGAVYGLGWFLVQLLAERVPQVSRSSSQAI